MNAQPPEKRDPGDRGAGARRTDPRPARAGPARRGGLLLLPAATFLVGLLLGAALVWVAVPDGDESGEAEGRPSPAPLPSVPAPTGTAEDIVVPAACLSAAQAADDVVRQLRDAVGALGELDTTRLRGDIERLEQLDAQIRADLARCQPQRTPAASPTGPTTPTATPTDTPAAADASPS